MTKKNNIEKLKKVRKKIDNIDNKIIELIGDRFKEIHKVTKLKENREEIIDHERITHILKSVQSKAKKNKIDAEIIVRIWQIFIQEAIKLESAKIKNNHTKTITNIINKIDIRIVPAKLGVVTLM